MLDTKVKELINTQINQEFYIIMIRVLMVLRTGMKSRHRKKEIMRC